MATKTSSPSVRSLSKTLSSLSKTASSVASTAKAQGKDTTGITNAINKSNAMVSQTERQGSKSFSGSKEEANYNANVITPQSLTPIAPIKIPPAPTTTAPDIAANNTALAGPDSGLTAGPNGTLTVAPVTDKYAGLTGIQSSFQEALDKLNQTAPTAASVQMQLEKDTQLKKKQQAVNDYTATLNTIVANRDANKLKVEGQGRGIPDVIIGGQQAQIDKEAAIQALPVQAQLAAAQGNLQLAQDHINTWGAILMKDASDQYNRKAAILTNIKDFATTIESKRIDDLNAANERTYQEKQALAKAKTAALSQALGQGAPASVMNAIKNATTPEDVAAATGIYNGDVLGQQIRREQLNALRNPVVSGGGSGDVVVANGVPLKKVTDKEIQDVNDTAIKAQSASKIIDNMINSIQKNGSFIAFGTEKGNRQSNKTALLLAMKALEGTGALDQGTIDVLSGTIPENAMFANDKGQIAKLENLKSILTDKSNTFINSYRGTTAEIDPRTTRVFQSAQAASVLTPEEDQELNALFNVGTSSNSSAAFNPSSFY